MKNLKILTRTYLYLLFLIILLTIFTPWFIRRGFSFLDEETIEVVLIVLLFGVGYFIYSLYRKELEKGKKELDRLIQDKDNLEVRLDEAFRYIGKVNVQVEEIKDVFSKIEKYPETKQDLKFIFEYLANKILGIIDVDWTMLRIVDRSNLNTLKEYSVNRGGSALAIPKIPNKEIVENNTSANWQVLKSDQSNLNIKAFCIFPRKDLSEDQRILIKGITGQLEMLFVIFSSLSVL